MPDENMWSLNKLNLQSHRTIRFLHLDKRRIDQPSHCWYDGRLLKVDEAIFRVSPETEYGGYSRPWPRYNFGPFILEEQGEPGHPVTLEQLIEAEAYLRKEVEGR